MSKTFAGSLFCVSLNTDTLSCVYLTRGHYTLRAGGGPLPHHRSLGLPPGGPPVSPVPLELSVVVESCGEEQKEESD